MTRTHVLVPLDGSPLAEEALAHALDTFDCRVTVLNVVTPIDRTASEGLVLEAGADRLAEARERTERIVEDVRGGSGGHRTVQTTVETGQPADRILAYVEDHDVDHVVMGGHGGHHGEVVRRLLGTVSTAVVGEASVPVTVVR